MAPSTSLVPRQYYEPYGASWWYSTTGYIVRWVLFGVFILIILLWSVGGYFHAKQRMKKGLPPKAYHSCFYPRRPPTHHSGWYYRPPQGYYGQQPQDGYNMNYMPPPTYDTNRPPEYQQGPPTGATKVDPSQWRNEPTRRPAESSMTGANAVPEYEMPPGPPPPATRL